MDIKSSYTTSPTISANIFYEHVKRYRLHSALAEVGVVTHKLLFNNDEELKKIGLAVINEWQMAFTAKALILSSNDYKRQPFGDKGLFAVANLFNNLYDPLMDDKGNPGSGYSFLFRVSNQQFPFQTGVRTLIPRALLLFNEIPSKIPNPSIDIPAEIKKIYGLTPEEIIMMGFCILVIGEQGYLDTKRLTNTPIEGIANIFTHEKIDRLLESISSDYDGLRRRFRNDETHAGLEQYAFNALRQLPVVKTQSAGYVIPVARFLLERVTSGIFYSLMDNFRTEKGNKFLTFFGKEVFERYVGMLLRHELGEESVLAEWHYGKSQKHTPDWIILEGSRATLIECKTGGITKEAKSWGSLIKISNDIKRHVVEGIKQMAKFEASVRAREKGLERVHHIHQFNYVLLTYDRIFMANSDILRKFIDTELKKDGITAKYDIISIKEIEEIAPLLKRHTFSDLIDTKQKNPEYVTWDFDVFLNKYLKNDSMSDTNNTLLEDYWDILLKRFDPGLTIRSERE